MRSATSHSPIFFAGSNIPARPIELARSAAADFDAHTGSVRLWSRKGNDGSIRERKTVLSTAGVAFFKEMARGKLPAAPLFTSPSPDLYGGQWRHHQWATGIRTVASAVNEKLTTQNENYIPRKACAYSFRHLRISELLQVNKLDPVTVSELTGTSLEIIKEPYWHVIVDRTHAALAKLDIPVTT